MSEINDEGKRIQEEKREAITKCNHPLMMFRMFINEKAFTL